MEHPGSEAGRSPTPPPGHQHANPIRQSWTCSSVDRGLVERNALRQGAYGCPLGSLAAEVADVDEEARKEVERYFAAWQGLLSAGLERMRGNGVLRANADPDALATGLLAALQGGYLLAQTARDVRPMEVALDMAIAHVRSFAS